MVRAAVSGAVDYSRADPTDNRWRLKHRLLLTEIQRQEAQRTLEYRHQHLCAYLGHGNLTEDSFKEMKKAAGNTLDDLEKTTFPWRTDKPAESKQQKSKIDAETQRLIDRYKQMFGDPGKK
jgi:hypothetical protein